MKKTLVLCLMFMLCIVASAQHMKFMGIPLDGTISSFTTKLQVKGVKISPYNKYASVGHRLFCGTFYGQKADIFVFYNPSTKIVYRAKALINRQDLNQLKDLYDNISASIDSKYKGRHKEGTYEGRESMHYDIDLKTSADYYEGIIDLYFSEDDDAYYLHVDYYDEANMRKHVRSINNDI